MKLLHWNYLRDLFLIILQAVLLTIFAHPWLQLAAAHWDFRLSSGSLWFFITAVGSIAAIAKSVGRGKQGLWYAAAAPALAFVLALIWRLPLVLTVPLALALLYAGVRFSNYPSGKNFAFDWGWSLFFLLIALLMEERLSYELGFALTFLYFVLGFLAIILWNAKSLEKEGLALSYGSLGRFVPLFVLGAAGLSVALGLLLSPAVLQRGITILGAFYDGVLEILFFLFVRPFAWLMSPLFRWAERQELSFQSSPLDEIASERPFGDATSGAAPQTVRVVTSVGWIVFVAILLVVVWVAVRRIVKRVETKRESGTLESRESVFSGEEVLGDLKRALQNLVKPLSRFGRTRWYRGEDPILLIRNFYARFIVGVRKEVPYLPGSTPEEYRQELGSGSHEVDLEALQSLTTIYNRARYGEMGDENDVEGAAQAFSKLRR